MAQLSLAPLSLGRPGSSSSILPAPSRASSPDQGDSDFDDAPLPFPTALSRRDFVAPDFDPAVYLSALHSGPTTRHQTLEDLRSELRERSGAISSELLELVNANYTSFLSLGDELKGGHERVEDVRVALLGFRRAVEDVQNHVQDRKTEVRELSDELGSVKLAIETGRAMLELDERVTELENRLALDSLPRGKDKTAPEDDWAGLDGSEDEDDDEDEAGFVGSSPAKLERFARDYMTVERLADELDDFPMVARTGERILRCRNTILLDLGSAIKDAKRAGVAGQARIVRYLGIYRTLGAAAEAVKILKEK